MYKSNVYESYTNRIKIHWKLQYNMKWQFFFKDSEFSHLKYELFKDTTK